MGEQDLANLEVKDEMYSRQLSIEQKRALIAEAKKRYGKDWTKLLNFGNGGKGSGIDWNMLRFRLS